MSLAAWVAHRAEKSSGCGGPSTVESARGAAVRRCVLYRSRVDLSDELQLPEQLTMLLQRARSGDCAVPASLFVAVVTGTLCALEVGFVRSNRRAHGRRERHPDTSDLASCHNLFPVVVRPVVSGSKGMHIPWFVLCSLFGCNLHDTALFDCVPPPSSMQSQQPQQPAVLLDIPVARPFVVATEKKKKQPKMTRAAIATTTTDVAPVSVTTFFAAAPVAEPVAAPVFAHEIPKKKEKSAGTIAVPVDSQCNLDDAHVVIEDGVVWDCMLNQTNISANNNKFYVIQLLERKGSFLLWTRWGRVGEIGQSGTLMCGGNLAKAKAAFEKKFTEKTQNSWSNRDHFIAHPGKYTLIQMDRTTVDEDEKEEEEEDQAAISAQSPFAVTISSLPEPVQRVTALVFDVKMMERQMTELEFDVKKQPLGKLSRSQINAGHVILRELEKHILQQQQGGPRATPTVLMELSSKFYTLIPHNFGRQRPPIIDNVEALRKKVSLLEALANVEVATSMLKDSASLDDHYRQLHASLEVVDAGSDDDQLIRKFVATTHPHKPPQIKTIFRIEREGEAERYGPTKSIGNRMLLWHGSRLSNFAGIISQGLRIAPPEAPVTGYRFGKGVYFADLCGVSASYCHAQPGDEFLMLLTEVSLGTPAELDHDQYMERPLPGFDSTKALGQTIPDPSEFVTTVDGVTVPCGHPIPAPRQDVSCTENEYVVYDETRAHLRFMLHLVCQ